MTETTQAHQGNWLPGNYARIQAALAALPPPAERGLALAAVFDELEAGEGLSLYSFTFK